MTGRNLVSIRAATVATVSHALPSTRDNRLLILIYHRVHPHLDPMFPREVDADRFDWQMALLRRYCHPLALTEGVAELTRGALPPRAVAVTFDDGYADNATVALPILQRHGISATFFIASGFLNGGRMWNDSIIEAIRVAPDEAIDLGDYGLGPVLLGPEEARGAVAESIIKAVKHLPRDERQHRVTSLCERIAVNPRVDLMMTSEQVLQLYRAGMEIGAHTITHPILRTLSDRMATDEIQGSRAALEAITGGAVRAFAYPNGRPGNDYTERDRNLVSSLGFDYAPSTRWGVATHKSDIFQLPRFTPWDRTPARWLARLLLTFRTPA